MVKYQCDGKVAPECDDADEQREKIGANLMMKNETKWKSLRSIKLLRFPLKKQKQRRFFFFRIKVRI